MAFITYREALQAGAHSRTAADPVPAAPRTEGLTIGGASVDEDVARLAGASVRSGAAGVGSAGRLTGGRAPVLGGLHKAPVALATPGRAAEAVLAAGPAAGHAHVA